MQIYTTYSIYGVLVLSHQCMCGSTKLISITKERLSLNRRIDAMCYLYFCRSMKSRVFQCVQQGLQQT